MAQTKTLIDEYGIIYRANKKLPDDQHRIQLVEALAELEDNNCHQQHNFPKTRLHKVKGIKEAIYRADINKTSGWRIHLQYDKQSESLKLKDIIEGQKHDDVINIIKSKRERYE
jgi:hypothetical protein